MKGEESLRMDISYRERKGALRREKTTTITEITGKQLSMGGGESS